MPFWQTLSSEVKSLRDALEDDASDDDRDADSPAYGSPLMSVAPFHDLLVCSPAAVSILPGSLPEPSRDTARQLYDIFLHNVDPVFKVVHRPTIQRLIESNGDYLGYGAELPPARALKATMWFSAVTTLNDADCAARFPIASRSVLLQLYRRHVDVALASADFLNTRDLPTLQAALLYTAASRITDQSRRPWTMTGLIVRIAYGMNLNTENSTDSPYMKETKRRLWHQLRVLDAFAAVDRGTTILISMDSFDTPLPSNVNDVEFDENSTSVPNREEGLTDSTFNLMAHAASTLTMRLLTPEINGSKGATWQQRLDKALELGKSIRERYLKYCDLSLPFHRFLYSVGNSMAASSVLRAVRPMQRHVSSVPPRVDSPFVLQLAVNSLRESENTHADVEAAGWRWIFWVQWHALAVALAGLCSIRDTELANTAWLYVERSYERHAQHIADSRSGLLWRPIEKLYKTASAFRDAGKGSKPAMQAKPWIVDFSLSPAVPAAGHPLHIGSALHSMPGNAVTIDGHSQPNEPTFNTASTSLQFGDMSWMDFERIMEDINSLNPDAMNGLSLGDMQAPTQLSGDWPYPLNPGSM